MCSKKDSAPLFPLSQSFAALAQIYTRFSPPKVIVLCVLLQCNSRCDGICFLNCLLVPGGAFCVTRCVLWTGATETCPFTSTWEKQWWNETNGDLAFMWGQIRNPVEVQATHWHLSWYGWLPEEACLSHLPFCLGHKSTLDGDIQTGQITSPGGLHPLHQFGTYSFLFLPFGHAWDAAEPCKEGVDWKEDGLQTGLALES